MGDRPRPPTVTGDEPDAIAFRMINSTACYGGLPLAAESALPTRTTS
ncbi:hypothetical protein RISK_003680 [Rhodopirellula islandica]|uniref:Uncharacterized protein n=1 Tax=Rhodopirellula islandica TaxID=595434 RepID=A0A0J1EEY7_RHOIS|nr:hypothetical protein RISK_003680 [Rhodopirellula islandica]